MRKALIYWFTFLAILLAMTSCKSAKVVTEKVITKDSISVTTKDTVFDVPKDSSRVEATLEVQNGNVVIKQINSSKSGRKLKTPTIKVKDNVLTVDCETEAEKLFASWKETYVQQYREHQKPVVTNILKWWQKTLITIGVCSLLALAIWLLLELFKFKKL